MKRKKRKKRSKIKMQGDLQNKNDEGRSEGKANAVTKITAKKCKHRSNGGEIAECE